MSERRSIDFVRAHFEGKGFGVWVISDCRGQSHTLDVTQGTGEKIKIVMSFRISRRHVDFAHLKEGIKRYAAGEPLVHPWTGETA